jgi:C4-dicarboxylate-specific signal transduction histidine kinase
MAAQIAHEINQSLAAIATFSAACSRGIASGSVDSATLTHWLETINQQAKRAGDHIRRTRTPQPQGTVSALTCDLVGLAGEVIAMLDCELRRSQIDVRIERQTETCTARCDPILVKHVMVSLIRNAVDAMGEVAPHQRQLRLRGHAEGQRIEFSISDRGLGVREELRPHIFRPFVSSRPDRLGLGLAVSRAIVESLGGELWEDPNHEHGATFKFSLPTLVSARA